MDRPPQSVPDPAEPGTAPEPSGSSERAADRQAGAETRRNAADRREDWADYVGRADTEQDRAAAASDLEEDRRDAAADQENAAGESG
jgi:hypothetical protein